jgi:hypothetical protein
MKIAFLNPWSDAAESHASMFLAIAARRIGIDLITAKDESDLQSCGADFVISVASSVPKVSDYPTYLNVHEPTSRFLQNEFYLRNFMTYDGYLTISDSLRRFVRDVSFGIGRPDEPGFYFGTAQKSDVHTNLPEIVKNGQLRIAYFGTNWDRRSPRLFELLDPTGILRIHGPKHSWPTGLASYHGPLPFDGVSPQKTYASCGLGLVLLSAGHLREDVISDRIFQISSVGAVSICPDIPWIRKWFADSVFYFEPFQAARQIRARIADIYEHCKQNPSVAARMGEAARAVFEKDLCAERLLENAVDYHEANRRKRTSRLKRLGGYPQIAVIVRCGGRATAYVENAVNSVRSQTFGRFKIVFVKYKPVDLSQIISRSSPNIDSFLEMDVPNGNRGQTLFAGLAKLHELGTEYFAVLDDDDFWLSNHVESLFVAAKHTGRDFDVAFSGTIAASTEARQIEKNLWWKWNVYTFGYRGPISSTNDLVREFCSNCFIARTSLLPNELDRPDMETAEDSLIVSLLSRRSKPVFSYEATAFFRRQPGEGSNFDTHPDRQRDLTSVGLRTGFLYGLGWLPQSSIAYVPEQRSVSNPPNGQENIPSRVLIDGMVASADESIKETSYFAGRMLYLTNDRIYLLGHSSIEHTSAGKIIRVLPLQLSWEYGVDINLDGLLHQRDQFLIVEFGNITEPADVGLLGRDDAVVERVQLPADKNVEVWLRINAPSEVVRMVVMNAERPLVHPVDVLRIWAGRQTEQPCVPGQRFEEAAKTARRGYALERAQNLEYSEVYPLVTISLDGIAVCNQSSDTRIAGSRPVIVSTAAAPWDSSAVLPLPRVREMDRFDENLIYFWQIETEVRAGEAGVAMVNDGEVLAQRVLTPADGRKSVYFPADDPVNLMIRNGSHAEKSSISLYAVRLVRDRSTGGPPDMPAALLLRRAWRHLPIWVQRPTRRAVRILRRLRAALKEPH